ncbi:hypothetical protein GGR58DRAFT_493735 [Xylaria digitata]|nr:hypothetical protein GGR58DRAFT_493735 [Xylaria digitata]
MFSRDETVSASLRFYQQILRHPYLNEGALIIPPLSGWDNINVQGKNETVLDTLHHLPYLRSNSQFCRLLVYWETIPICYCDDTGGQEIYPLPSHCVYLACSVDREGINLILDTIEGTITEFSHVGYHITVPHEDYEALPEAEKWKAHRTSPATELLDSWTRKFAQLVWMLVPNPIGQPATGRCYSRAVSDMEGRELILQERLFPWHPQDDPAVGHGDETDGQRAARIKKPREKACGGR